MDEKYIRSISKSGDAWWSDRTLLAAQSAGFAMYNGGEWVFLDEHVADMLETFAKGVQLAFIQEE